MVDPTTLPTNEDLLAETTGAADLTLLCSGTCIFYVSNESSGATTITFTYMFEEG